MRQYCLIMIHAARSTPPYGRPAPAVTALLLAALLAATPGRGTAQEGDRLRVGIALGGVSTIGLVLEQVHDWGSFELIVGTWSFRDLSVSLVHRQRIGGGDTRAVAGLGLWGVLSFPPEGQTGFALLARAPVGLEWQATDLHYLTAEIGLNRALTIRRTDPEDETPLNRRVVPLPGASWRWESR